MSSLRTGKLGETRSLESGAGARRRASRRLRSKGYSRAAEKMALDAENLALEEKAMQGSGIRSAEQDMDLTALKKQKSKSERALASGFRPPTKAATGQLLDQRRSLFDEMKTAREAGKDVKSFRDRATKLGVTDVGFESAVSKLPALQTPGEGPTPPATTTSGLGFGDVGTATTPPATTPPATPPPSPATRKMAPAQNKIWGLPSSLAKSLNKEYLDIPSRMQRLLRTPSGKDLSEDPEAVKSLEQRLRRRANVSARDLLLKGVDPYSREGMLLEEHYSMFPDDDADPREVLTRLKDKQNRDDYAATVAAATAEDAEKPAMSPEELDKLIKSARGISDVMRYYRSGQPNKGSLGANLEALK